MMKEGAVSMAADRASAVYSRWEDTTKRMEVSDISSRYMSAIEQVMQRSRSINGSTLRSLPDMTDT